MRKGDGFILCFVKNEQAEFFEFGGFSPSGAR